MSRKPTAAPHDPRATPRSLRAVQTSKIAARPDRNFRSIPRRNTSEFLPQILRRDSPAQIQPFVHLAPLNSPRINTSEKFPISRILLIRNDFNPTRINTSGNKDLKSIRINTSGSKDLKSFRINTSKKQGRGEGFRAKTPPTEKSALPLFASLANVGATLSSRHFIRERTPFIDCSQFPPSAAPRMTRSHTNAISSSGAASPTSGGQFCTARAARYNELLIRLHRKQSRVCGTASVVYGRFSCGARITPARQAPSSGKR
jgi:hypothetical protein